ncbi:unnamed protein product [Chilo suppressalis]|uniref:Major facilitator superfamily (MFS) profile domain-containing protein n=1 Tax=Chilo suppressalis TaxID=168631 RepID=A0ABN8B332_CHISP|nr:unnamed protein product [Chilo suppressalis]
MTNGNGSSPSRAKVITSQVYACLALNFLLVGLGMSINFVTMVLPAVMDAPKGLSITMEQASWFGSIAFLCQPLGSIFSGPLMDYFGRKKSLFLVNIPHVIAWLLIYYAWDVPSLFIGNALLGIGTGIMEAPAITYVGEVSEPSVRGFLTTLTNGFTSTGMFMAYLLGSVLPWRYAALAALSIPVITMVLVLFVPETPVWLLSKGRQKEALRSLCRLRGWAKPEEVKEEFDQLVTYNDIIQQCVICAKEGKSDIRPCEHDRTNLLRKSVMKFKHVFLVKETLRPFILVMAYFFFHAMSGFLPIRPNMVNLCGALGMKYDSKAIVRKLILGALFATSCCTLGLSIYAGTNLPLSVFSYEVNTFPEAKSFTPVLLFMLLVCFNSLGIPWVVLSRGVATGLAAALSYVIFFLSSKTNYNLEASMHLSGTFALYSAFGLVGTIYLYFFMPETESKSLEEIEAFYKGGRKIFADDFLINSFRKKLGTSNERANLY